MTKPNEKLVELRRHLKVARRTAVNARTSARITLKQIVVTAPPALRETLHPLADQALLNRCRGWRCGTIDTPTASAKTYPPGARPSLVRSLRRNRGPRPSLESTHHLRDAPAAGPGVCSCSAASACPVDACATIAGRFVSVARA